MDNIGEGLIKKKGQKRKHVTDEERGAIKALLKLQLYTGKEIGEMVGRSADVVEIIARNSNLPMLNNTKKSEEYKARLAMMFGDLSEKMLGSLAKEGDAALKKTSIAQRAMVAGIAADKLCTLTKKDKLADVLGVDGVTNVQLSWVQLVQQSTPGRAKDGTLQPVSPATSVIDVEVVQPLPVSASVEKLGNNTTESNSVILPSATQDYSVLPNTTTENKCSTTKDYSTPSNEDDVFD